MKKSLIVTIIVTSLILGGCSSNSASTKTTASTTTSSTSSKTATTTATDMTTAELAKYDGQNGNPAYVAVNGVIYDVSSAKGWQNGVHRSGVKAGLDQTDMIAQSPHGDSVLQGLPVIGKLK